MTLSATLERVSPLSMLDAQATALGSLVAYPTGLLGDVVAAIRETEVQDTALVIDRLDRALETAAP